MFALTEVARTVPVQGARPGRESCGGLKGCRQADSAAAQAAIGKAGWGGRGPWRAAPGGAQRRSAAAIKVCVISCSGGP